jgi:hypothetical protein
MNWTYITDEVLRQTVETSRSLREAATRLGVSQTYVRTRANRIGVRSQFRYGVEKLPPTEHLVGLLQDAHDGRGRLPLARRLGVQPEVLAEAADELGMDCRYVVRAGLPDDTTLRHDLLTCGSFSELAREYGVADHMVRNQARRLGVPAPSKRASRPVVREHRVA